MILVTGAAGKTGQSVIRTLIRRSEPVRALVFRAEQQALMRNIGVQETIVGDMQTETVLRQACREVRAIYHICPNMSPDEVNIGRNMLTAAREAGINRFVYHSVLHPQTEAMPHHWNKLRVEALLLESGLDFTILQPAAYMQNILAGWNTIVQEGLYRIPYPARTRLGPVHLEDVATAAATVLTAPGHSGATYELAGPDVLSQTEMVDILSEVLNRPVRVEQLSIAAWTKQAQTTGLGSYQIDTLVKMFRYYEQYHFWGNSRVLGWLLDRRPTGFRAFAEQVARRGT